MRGSTRHISLKSVMSLEIISGSSAILEMGFGIWKLWISKRLVAAIDLHVSTGLKLTIFVIGGSS